MSESEDTIEEMDEIDPILAREYEENMDAIDAIIARAYAGEELSEDDVRKVFPPDDVQSELASAASGGLGGGGWQGGAWAYYCGPSVYDLSYLKEWERVDLVVALEDKVTGERLKEVESGAPITDDEWKIIRDWRSECLAATGEGDSVDLLVVSDRKGRCLSVTVGRTCLFGYVNAHYGVYLDNEDPYEGYRDEWTFLDWPDDLWMSATEEWYEIEVISSHDFRP
jgi:hypothetical protein